MVVGSKVLSISPEREIGICPIPDDEWEIMNGNALVKSQTISRLCILGNKGAGKYERYLFGLGFAVTQIDINGLDGALAYDLEKPMRDQWGKYDAVLNFGTTEHVDKQAPCWENVHKLIKVGGYLICSLPRVGSWPGHAPWYFDCNFFAAFAGLYGYQIEALYLGHEKPNQMVYCRMRKHRTEFAWDPMLEKLMQRKDSEKVGDYVGGGAKILNANEEW